MITIGMWIGFFIGMWLSSSLIGYTLFGLIGIWCGATVGVLCSDSRKDTWLVNKKEAIRLTLVFVFAFIVRFFAEVFISNHIIILLIHLAALLVFDSWHQVIRGAIDWQQLVCIGGGILAGITIVIKCDIPSWLGFFFPIIGGIAGNIAYSKLLLPKIRNDEKELLLGCRLYGIIAVMDGGISIEEKNYFISQFSKMLSNDLNRKSVIDEFCNAEKEMYDWNVELSNFVKTAYLNQSENIDDYILDLCFFALLRQHGEISNKRYSALKQLVNEFDIPLFFFDRLLEDLKDNFTGNYMKEYECYEKNTK